MSETYHDRRMLKWLPFEALEEQGEYYAALYETMAEEERPELARDHCDAMQYAIEEAWMEKRPIEAVHFENRRRRRRQGRIQGIDIERRLLFIGETAVFFDDIVDIQKL